MTLDVPEGRAFRRRRGEPLVTGFAQTRRLALATVVVALVVPAGAFAAARSLQVPAWMEQMMDQAPSQMQQEMRDRAPAMQQMMGQAPSQMRQMMQSPSSMQQMMRE